MGRKITVTTKTGKNTYATTEVDSKTYLLFEVGTFILRIIFLPVIVLYKIITE